MQFRTLARHEAEAVMEDAAHVLGEQFPQHIPGERDGWLVMSRNDRPMVVWDLAVKISADTPEQEAKRLELGAALAAAGYAVTFPTSAYMVYFADPPTDPASPRYEVAESFSTLSALFGGAFPIVDTYTGVDVTWADDRAEAERMCAVLNEQYETAKARIAAGEESGGTILRVELRAPEA
ncbi:hypothetical protein [Streptomyces sp. NPDC001536]|uniref:hypothetical protein n=1 Tax=Streptomyces sp. NPDC001536 TaxID=3364583 RepID=UPI003688436B